MSSSHSDGYWPPFLLAYIRGSDIARLRKVFKLSRAELARRSGIYVKDLQRIEEGVNRPSPENVEKLDRVFGEIVRKT